MKKKILYFTQVPWGWIKQRPQFLAEELASYYDVDVVFFHDYKKYPKEGMKVGIKQLIRLPLERILAVFFINQLLAYIQLYFLRKKYDIIWLTSYKQYKYFSAHNDHQIIIYDCMDDVLEFPGAKNKKKSIMEQESLLFKEANYVFCSAEHLRSTLIDRYGQRSIVVINNAVSNTIERSPLNLPNALQQLLPVESLNITYIGTIAEWMDWKLLKFLVETNNNVRINLFGPIACIVPDLPERICLHGPIDYKYVSAVMNASDILIMPFLVTELIKSVNPVKLYEYIYSGKPCLAPRYGESAPFGEYVYLYNDSTECCYLIRKIEAAGCAPKQSKDNCRLYALKNTWSQRAASIYNTIEEK